MGAALDPVVRTGFDSGANRPRSGPCLTFRPARWALYRPPPGHCFARNLCLRQDRLLERPAVVYEFPPVTAFSRVSRLAAFCSSILLIEEP